MEPQSVQAMMGKRVISGDGARLGRVYSCRAEVWRGEDRGAGEVRVTHVLVGVSEWLELLWPHEAVRRMLAWRPPLAVPWAAVETIDHAVRLKPHWTRAMCLALCGRVD